MIEEIRTTYTWRVKKIKTSISKPINCFERTDAKGSFRKVNFEQFSAGIIRLEYVRGRIDRIPRQEILYCSRPNNQCSR